MCENVAINMIADIFKHNALVQTDAVLNKICEVHWTD